MKKRETFNEPTVLIMMATYNSEKYLKKQLDSIVNQTYKKWNLVVQDDGSSDNTVKIIKDYMKIDSRIKLEINTSQYHGPYYNFHSLIQKCKGISAYNFYMFSDHDDIWKENKIKAMLGCFYGSKLSKKPLLIYGDMTVIDGNDQIKFNSLNEKIGIKLNNNISTFFAANVFGCNTMFNQELFEKIPPINMSDSEVKTLAHDNFIAKLAATYGNISYCSRPLMYYRRYGSNVTSKNTYTYSFRRIISRLLGLKILAADHALTYKQTLYFIKIVLQYDKELNPKYLKKISNVIQNGGMKSVIFIITNRISWGKKIKTLSRTFILFSRLYKRYL